MALKNKIKTAWTGTKYAYLTILSRLNITITEIYV